MEAITNKPNLDFIKNRWIPALRNGSYKQGRMALRREDNTYCCLGVACDLMGVDWVRTADGGWGYPEYNETNGKIVPFIQTAEIGTSIANKIGVEYYIVYYPDGVNSINLIGLNDSNVSFANIADMLEELVNAWEDYDASR